MITPTHWIACTGEIVPVVILKAGIGGHNPKFVPPDPVVVLSIEDHLEFVASERCLFTDRTLAIEESRRLREAKVREINAALARVERQELLKGTGLLDTLSIPLKEGSGTQVSVVDTTTVSSATQAPAEAVVSKKKEDVATEKPSTLLERVIYVIGRDTVTFEEICQRLTKRHWFPKLRSSVSNVLSAHKNLFNCPSRGVYSLRTKPKANPIDEAVTDSSEAEELQTEADIPEEDIESEEDGDPKEEGSSEEDSENNLREALTAVSDDEDSSSVQPSEFSVWMNKPMRELTPEHSHFRDDDVVLSEKLSNGTWTVEIYITGLELWSEGNSGDRAQAREVAENNLQAKVQNISRIVEDLGI